MMFNISLDFSRPWFLLLLIPAVVLTLLPYLKMNRKYRRTRNRILSITLHLLIMVMSITLLSGMTFVRTEVNKTNEIMLVVDMSYSSKASERQRNEFVKSVIDQSENQYKLGIMTFGLGEVQYSVPLSNDTSTMYQRFLNAPAPDDRGTNIAVALEAAVEKFDNPSAGKIVVLTDGIETDGSVMSVVKNIAANVRVDFVYFPSIEPLDIQITNIVLPSYNVVENEEISIDVSLQSSIKDDEATIRLYDNEQLVIEKQVPINFGPQTIALKHKFETSKLHRLKVEIDSASDTVEENSIYCTHIYLATYDRVLVLEREASSTDTYLLEQVLKDRFGVNYNDKVEISPLTSVKDMTLEELREWDEVVLVNISNDDIGNMAEGFDVILNKYVSEYGGGLLTIGGDVIENGESVANTYKRGNMVGTLYQSMLPVLAVDYTPPIAVIIVLDTSSSMSARTTSGDTLMDLAKAGAATCVNNLDERDYVGVVTFSDKENVEIGLTPLTQKRTVLDTISRITQNGGTVYLPAIEAASRMLKAEDNVELKHIIFVTDGEPQEISNPTALYDTIEYYYNTAGIKMSVLAINPTSRGSNLCEEMARRGGNGGYSRVSGTTGDLVEIPSMMRDFLTATQIGSTNEDREFDVRINEKYSNLVLRGIENDAEIPKLWGFYGTRLKVGAELVLSGEYGVPIYAQRKLGNGKVGSIMCELSGSPGSWSRDFMSNAVGQQMVWNIIWSLLPNEDIRVKDIRSKVYSQNSITTVDIITSREEGDKIHVAVSKEGVNEPTRNYIAEGDGDFSRSTFEVFDPGTYRIVVQKEIGGVYQEAFEYYTSFSYSKEYNLFIDLDEQEAVINEYAQNAKGSILTEPKSVFDEFDMKNVRAYNPLIPFAILCIIMFLLDIAVRKFKFRWPHEIIRDNKLKKQMSQAK